jgi:hypothetical protein
MVVLPHPWHTNPVLGEGEHHHSVGGKDSRETGTSLARAPSRQGYWVAPSR